MDTARDFYNKRINPDVMQNQMIHETIIVLMEEYAEQFKDASQSKSVPSDEEIEKKVTKKIMSVTQNGDTLLTAEVVINLCIKLCKWIHSQLPNKKEK